MSSPPSRTRLVLVGGMVTIAALAPAAEAKPAKARHDAPRSSSKLALKWFDLSSQTVAAAAFPEQSTQGRTWAVSWLAAARAVADGHGKEFRKAAFATALHDTLAAQVPSQASALDDALDETLARIPAGNGRKHGIAAGRHEAAELLEERDGDGLDTASVNAPWTPPQPAPGVYQPTPPFPAPDPPVVRAGLGKARSFLLAHNDQFRPAPPPPLDSPTYLEGLAEVRSVGQDTSSTRTPQQTDTALFWEQSSINAYNQVLRGILTGADRGLLWQTRLVAAFHVVTIDAQIAIHEAKYAYVFWRPVTAIRTGSVDQDAGWTPLFVSPRHPEYPSGHTGYAGAAQQVLASLVGPRPQDPIGVTSPTNPGVTHTFSRWSEITQENVDGRVWEGVHFRFSDNVGVQVGRQVAEWDLPRLRSIGL
jgi:hypothetical protein